MYGSLFLFFDLSMDGAEGQDEVDEFALLFSGFIRRLLSCFITLFCFFAVYLNDCYSFRWRLFDFLELGIFGGEDGWMCSSRVSKYGAVDQS